MGFFAGQREKVREHEATASICSELEENQAEEARLSLPLLLPQEPFSESEQNAEENVGFALLAFGNTVDEPSHSS